MSWVGRELGRIWVSSQGLGTRFIVPSMNSPQLLPHNNLSTGALIGTYCLVGGYCCMKGTLLGKISQEPTQHLPHHEKLVSGGGNFPVSSRVISLCLSARVNIPDNRLISPCSATSVPPWFFESFLLNQELISQLNLASELQGSLPVRTPVQKLQIQVAVVRVLQN